jgi:UPF0716 protein FxsA
MKLSPVLILIPLIELAFLIALGKLTSGFVVFCTVVGTGVLGAALIKFKGMGAVKALQGGQMPQGGNPGTGIFMMIAGVFLIIPGLITDLIGLIILTPPLRKLIVAKLQQIAMKKMGGMGGQNPFAGMGGMDGQNPFAGMGGQNPFAQFQQQQGGQNQGGGNRAAKRAQNRGRRKKAKDADYEILD